MQVEPLTPAVGSHIYYTYTVDVLPAIILRHFSGDDGTWPENNNLPD